MAVLEELILTVSNFARVCSGLERTDFNSFYIGKVWQSRKKLFYVSSFEKVWQSLKKLILTVSTLGRCVSLKRTGFNSFYFARVLWS